IYGTNSIAIFGDFRYTNISNNVINSAATISTGIKLDSDSDFNNIWFNEINLTQASSTGINVYFSDGNLINQNNLIIPGSNSYGIYLFSAQKNSLENNLIETTSFSIYDNYAGYYNIVLFNNSFAQIFVNKTNLTTQLNLSQNTIYLEQGNLGIIDSDKMQQLNGSATIQLRNLTEFNETPLFLKNGEVCDDINMCNISWNNDSKILTANVSSFSNYSVPIIISAYDGCDFIIDSCQDLDSLGVYCLNESVISDSTCFNVLSDNIGLNCLQNKINYSMQNILGYGVNVTGYDNVTVKNCIITENSITPNYKYAIYLSNSNNNSIDNNSILTIGQFSYGFKLESVDDSIFLNNLINSSGSYGRGIVPSSCVNDSFFNNIIYSASNSVMSSGSISNFLNFSNNYFDKFLTVKSDNLFFFNNTINNSVTGLTISDSEFPVVKNNSFYPSTAHSTAISLDESAFGLFLGNNFHSNSALKISSASSPSIYLNHTFLDNNHNQKDIKYDFGMQDQIILENQNLTDIYSEIFCAYCLNVTYSNITFNSGSFYLL
ncbi:hypothetical protein HN415_09610, partial [Candidatus Woesearchaeota archaeon]|nr:hypothetical protein [Candidatus Woesearchaeota archaeon]